MSEARAQSSRLLLVEGENDRRFLSGMLGYMSLTRPVQITSYHGKNNLGHVLRGLRKNSAFSQGKITSIGVTRDADHKGCPAALQSLRGALYRAGLTQSERDIIPLDDNLQISAHIICGSNGHGRLEEMILEAVQHHPLMAYVDFRLEVLRRSSQVTFDEGKTRLSLFLNSQTLYAPEKVTTCFNFDHPVYDDLKNFLHSL